MSLNWPRVPFAMWRPSLTMPNEKRAYQTCKYWHTSVCFMQYSYWGYEIDNRSTLVAVIISTSCRFIKIYRKTVPGNKHLRQPILIWCTDFPVCRKIRWLKMCWFVSVTLETFNWKPMFWQQTNTHKHRNKTLSSHFPFYAVQSNIHSKVKQLVKCFHCEHYFSILVWCCFFFFFCSSCRHFKFVISFSLCRTVYYFHWNFLRNCCIRYSRHMPSYQQRKCIVN